MKSLRVIIALLLLLTFMVVTACNKKGDNNSKSESTQSQSVENSASNSAVNSQSESPSLSHNPNASDSFDYSYSSKDPVEKDEPDAEDVASFPTLYAMYKLGELDGSYNGTNAEIGFPKRNLRADNTSFETYPIGYGEGTTGGRGATAENIYECSTGLEVLSALSAIKEKQAQNPELKSIIRITGEITQANSTEIPNPTNRQLVFQIVPNSINNLSIIGANSNAKFSGVGVNFKSCNNVIVQNLTIHHPSQTLKNEKDCLEFNQCNYVWVDHCELYNDYPRNSGEKDYYDGLIDVKNQSSHVTISYNYLHDAFKTSLVGSGPDDLCETRTITYHHNIFKNLNSRVPAIRSGYGHVYNNYYENILGSAINCRIKANVFVENNVFVSAKKPVCADEDAVKGFYNISDGNIFTNCNWTRPTNTTDFTPSYEYTLDSAESLKTYLDATVGVGKVNVGTMCAVDAGYDKKYVIDSDLLINRAISELPQISLNNDCLQRLVYLSKQVLFADSATVQKITKLNELKTAINTYIDLFAKDLDSRIASINFANNFGENATLYLQAKVDYDNAEKLVKDMLKNVSVLNALTQDFTANKTKYFNDEVASLKDATADKMKEIENLLFVYNQSSDGDKQTFNYADLQEAYLSSKAHIVADEFELLCDKLPDANAINHNSSASILNAIKAYNNLTEKQFSFVDKAKLDRFENVYYYITTADRKMDVSHITAKVATESAVAGDINISKNMEAIHGGNVAFSGKTYTDYAYISGYGNRGSKSLWFSVYSKSTIKVVLSSINAGAIFVVADTDGNVIKTYTTENSNVCEIQISDLGIGEYRFYTGMPDATHTASTAYVYDFIITPTK